LTGQTEAPASALETKHRRSARLKAYDYSRSGAYFITICTQDRACLFGQVFENEVRLNGPGLTVQAVWDEMPAHYPGVEADSFVVMPNHIHGIIVLAHTSPDTQPARETGLRGQPRGVAPTDRFSPGGKPPTGLTLGDAVHRFKTMTTKRYTDGVKQVGWPPYRGRLWQRNYFEHVIRDEHDLARIRQYIADNPMRWSVDAENPRAVSPERELRW
jgi:REP element-mobilizing transposase RayT